jgi:TPR repeat protein
MSLARHAIVFSAAAALVAGYSSTADAQRLRPLSVCVIRNDALTTVPAMYDTETGDTLVGNRRFSQVYPLHSGYASAQSWYRDSKPVAFGDEVYSKFGLPRVYGVSELSRIGVSSGVGVYADAGERAPTRIYIPIRHGCEFQPYTPARDDAVVDFALTAIEKRDYATAQRLLSRPSLASHGGALAALGQMHHLGYLGRRDSAEARRLYERAIANKGREGYTGLGHLADSQGDKRRAMQWYRTGVSRGSTLSAARLAGMYFPGPPAPIEAAEAARMLRIVITRTRGDDPVRRTAQGHLSILYEQGRGVEGDAAEWFAADSVAALERADEFAQYRMGRRYEMGWATWPDSARAASHYRLGARSGDRYNIRGVERLGAARP